MASLFLSAMVLSIAFCAVPGAVTVEALRRGLHGGVRPALRFQLGAVIGAEVWAAMALLSSTAVAGYPKIHLALGLLGAVLVGRIAWGTFRDARSWPMVAPAPAAERCDLLAGAAVSLANPFALAFWLGASGGLLPRGGSDTVSPALAVVLVGLLAGSVLYRVLFTGLVAWGRRFITATNMRWVNGACGVVLSYYGLRLLAGTLGLL